MRLLTAVDDYTRHIKALPSLRDVISAHGLNPKKSLGQNFLLDQNVTDKIAHLALSDYGGDLNDLTVFEVGSGPGGLTRSLLKYNVKHVTAVEFDPRAVNALQGLKTAVDGRLDIIHDDAQAVDLCALSDAPRAVVANLPYNIATPLLVGWLRQIRENPHNFEIMALMFQREVANRIAANVGDKAYGRLSVLAGWLCRTARVYDLPPSVFTPPPKVDSAVVKFIPRDLPDDAPAFDDIGRVTAAAFGQRRKMIRSSLKAYLPAIERLGITPTKRAEELSVDEYVALAKVAV